MIGSSRICGAGFRESIGVATEVVGPTFMARLSHLQFIAGVDPIFAGVHGYEDAHSGRYYGSIAHCCYPGHLLGPRDRRVTTIILPVAVHPFTVVHELGHALHEVLNCEPDPDPVTEYAKTNRFEAFAEAFVRWCWPIPAYKHLDPASRALFDGLDR